LPSAAQNAHFPRGGLQQAFENLDARRFAGAVRSKQAESFAFADLQVQAAEGFDFAVIGLAQTTALDRQRHYVILAS